MAGLPDENVIQLWYHYEEVAMHFNELIMQYRLQLMGGTGALGAIASFVIGNKSDINSFHKIRAFTSFVILAIFSAAASLDVFYYNELLLGAVDALIELEGKYPEINLSTAINRRFTNGETTVVYWMYGLIITSMVMFTVWSAWRLYTYKRQKNV